MSPMCRRFTWIHLPVIPFGQIKEKCANAFRSNSLNPVWKNDADDSVNMFLFLSTAKTPAIQFVELLLSGEHFALYPARVSNIYDVFGLALFLWLNRYSIPWYTLKYGALPGKPLRLDKKRRIERMDEAVELRIVHRECLLNDKNSLPQDFTWNQSKSLKPTTTHRGCQLSKHTHTKIS